MQFDPNIGILDTTDFSSEKPVSPMGMLFTYYPSEEPQMLHYHDFLEIGYCEHGSGLFYVDGNVLPFNGRCVTIIYGGQPHIAQSINPGKSLWHFLYVNLSCLFSGANSVQLKDRLALHSDGYSFPSLIPYELDSDLYDLCKQIMAEAAQCLPGHLEVIRCLITALLIKHERYMVPSTAQGKDSLQLITRLREVLDYIAQNYMHDLSIDELSAISHMSKSSLQREMIAFTGMPVIKYMHHLRLNHASILLEESTKSVSAIAMEVGYNTLSCFNRKFLHEFGMSPTQWQKEHRKKSVKL